MFSKHKIVPYCDNVILFINIICSNMFENFDFNSSLILKFLLISDNLESKVLFSFMIKHPQALSKRSFSNNLKNLISKANMIINDYWVVSSVIIPISLFILVLYFCSKVINHWIFKYFLLFLLSEMMRKILKSNRRWKRKSVRGGFTDILGASAWVNTFWDWRKTYFVFAQQLAVV